ncbi:MAG: TM2 domain protein [Firmicutes bacterium ADurb.Bin193]|nr:MAG: TM2 domain protein [Firmicutes bacterium ADurb.Bin193]
MDANKLDMFMMSNSKFFPEEKLMFLKEKLAAMDDSRFSTISMVEFKDPTTMLLVSVFLGSLGIDRFMLGDTAMGILKLLTVGLCGILTIVDWFIISNRTKELNFMKIMSLI